MDVAAWLRRLGLEQYAQPFRDNDVDGEVLPELTVDDLISIGVTSVGHRRKLLAAIAALGTRPPPVAQAATGATSAPTSPPPIDAERRQLTVMFCDLVGSTALSARFDPEDLREVIAAYHRAVAEIVAGFDGFVAKYMGDGVLIYFGYPRAHEDDAERAIRAGLGAIDAVGRLDVKSAKLQARVGIATGLVVVGDLIGEGSAQEQSVVGETPNLAARLQTLAEPDAVVITVGTRRLVGDLFEYRDLGAVGVKGIASPVSAWQVLRPSVAASRFEALRGATLTRLVGRDEEIDLLVRRWVRVKAGDGQIVLVSGEAGLGKSRITVALEERVHAEPHLRLRYFCSPYHQDSALFPFIDQLGRAAGFSRDDPPASRMEKLEAVLTRVTPPEEDVALLADLMSLPTSERHKLPDLSPQRKKELTLGALIRQLEGLAREQPVVMVFEDAHWIDPTSRELLDFTVERVRNLPVLLIITFRPEFQPPWTDQPQVSIVALNRLDRRDQTTLVEQIADGKTLPDEIVTKIVDRADGVPLFVEELTKSVLESGLLREDRDRYVIDGALPSFAIPTSLHDSLMARLDRLASVRHVAQIGAAIGREFSYTLLCAVSRLPGDELQTALARLVASGLVFERGTPPDAVYRFKHALVQDAAHGSLLREPRRALHARIAETLESQLAEIAENQPELLARHWTEAGEIEKSAALWGRAGQRSAQRSALVEAAEQLRRALDQIATLPATSALRREEIMLQVALITPLLHVSGYATPETRAAVERARLLIEQAEALGESPEDPMLLFSVLYGLWVANLVAFNGDVLRALAVQFSTLADKQRMAGPLMIGHRLTGLSLLHTGDIANGRAHLDRAFTLYDAAEHRSLAARFGQDVGAASLFWKSVASWLLGYPQAARADTEQAIKIAREVGHSATLVYVLNFGTWTHVHCGNYAAANALVDETIALTDRTGSLYWGAWSMMQRGCISALTGKASHAVQTITSGVAAMRSSGTTMWMPLWFSYLARANAEIGQFDDARRCVGEAMIAVETTKETWYEAEAIRIAGETALLSPELELDKAEAYFERALAIAREQQAKSWELRVAMSMARLWRDQGRRRHARDLLAPVHGWFTEGFDTMDLKEARALLDELT